MKSAPRFYSTSLTRLMGGRIRTEHGIEGVCRRDAQNSHRITWRRGTGPVVVLDDIRVGEDMNAWVVRSVEAIRAREAEANANP